MTIEKSKDKENMKVEMCVCKSLKNYEDVKKDIENARSVGLAHWYEGRANGILETLLDLRVINVDKFSRETKTIMNISNKRREELEKK